MGTLGKLSTGNGVITLCPVVGLVKVLKIALTSPVVGLVDSLTSPVVGLVLAQSLGCAFFVAGGLRLWVGGKLHR